jgi:flagellar basal body P-ring formation protein FlgA
MRRLKFGLFWLVFVVLLFGVDQAHGALTFKSEAQVAGDYITLSNLADLPSDLAQKCGGAPVWSAPPPGGVYTLTKEFLTYRLKQLGLANFLEGVVLPPAIQVRQTGVLLKGEEVATVYQRYIQDHNPYPPKNLSIEVYPLKEAVIIPDPQVKLGLVPPKNDKFLGDVTLEMVISHQGQPIKHLKVSGMVRLKRQVVCANRPLRLNDTIGAGDVQILSREVTGLNVDDFFTSPEQVVGHILAKSVGPQEIITSRQLSHQPIIKKGDLVNVVLDQDGLEISTRGVAQEQGQLGKSIRLMNPKSKKEFEGLVVDAKTVRVQL